VKGLGTAALPRAYASARNGSRAWVVVDALAALPVDAGTDLASSLAHLGKRLSTLGRHDEALTCELNAVAICEDLAAADPGPHRLNLARFLTILGVRYSETRPRRLCLPGHRKAIAIYRDLIDTNQARFRTDLARALSNLDVQLSKLGRHAEAHKARSEAAAIRHDSALTP